MSIVRWQDLCIDAIDVGMQSEFWAAVSGLDIADGEAPARLGGPTPAHSLWVNPVDRPHRVKNRVHLDVYCASIDELVDLGASVLEPSEETGFGWTVMADPEGNEFCAFVRTPDRLPDYRIHGIGIDCAGRRGPGPLVGRALRRRARVPGRVRRVDADRRRGRRDHDARLRAGARAAHRAQPAHWDVKGDVAELLARGATHLWDQPHWTVLADPEGNEFCVFPPA